MPLAGAAGSPLADVTEFDWSWTGQFGAAGWFLPLESYLPASMLSDLANTNAFTGGVQVWGGTLDVDADDRLGAAANNVSLLGGTFQVSVPTGTVTTARSFTRIRRCTLVDRFRIV